MRRFKRRERERARRLKVTDVTSCFSAAHGSYFRLSLMMYRDSSSTCCFAACGLRFCQLTSSVFQLFRQRLSPPRVRPLARSLARARTVLRRFLAARVALRLARLE